MIEVRNKKGKLIAVKLLQEEQAALARKNIRLLNEQSNQKSTASKAATSDHTAEVSSSQEQEGLSQEGEIRT